MKVSDSPISSSLFAVYNAPVSCVLGFVWAGTAGECAQHLDGLWPAALAAGRLHPAVRILPLPPDRGAVPPLGSSDSDPRSHFHVTDERVALL